MKSVRFVPVVFAAVVAWASAARAASPKSCNVVWRTPSKDCHGSMPLGNGSTSLNAWINPAGELVFYLGRTDSWGDNGRLLKVGKVRVTLDPPPPVKPFAQTLSLEDATMVVRYGKGDAATVLRLWVDANQPVVRLTIDSPEATTATATIEPWRTNRATLPSIEVSDVLLDRSKPNNQHAPTIVEPDTILRGLTNRIGCYHRNIKSVGPRLHAEIQDMTGYRRADPLLHRVFGFLVTAANGRRLDDRHLQSPAARRHQFNLYVDTLHPATAAEWLARMEARIAADRSASFAARRRAHEAWWAERWNRSWILADGDEDARAVTRAYAWQRFITLCAGRGAYPIKFNGSIFTVPAPGQPGDADYRRWGPGYWWQNTRLPYFSMCASGDTDLMRPLFAQYIDRFLPLNLYRTQHYFHHGGAYYIECVYFWGDVFGEAYGWTPATRRRDKLQESGYHKWEWVSGPELAWLALDYYEYTGDETFLREKALPTADAVLRFFDAHYPVDENGRLVMHPSQALETWWDTTNPMPEIAGLRAVTRRLLALPSALTTPVHRAFWTAFLRKIPPLPTRRIEGRPAFAPAARFASKRNIENPELYCVFPFRLASFNRPNAALARNALAHRWDKGWFGWRQDDIFMAYLGLADQARDYLVRRARKHDPGSRFPGFWGPNYDWVPDQDHGSVLMKAFQAMLLQAEPETGDEFSGKIYLLPAWPRTWSVTFKLHAPRETVIEGRYHDGKLQIIRLTPATRRKDLVLPEGVSLLPRSTP